MKSVARYLLGLATHIAWWCGCFWEQRCGRRLFGFVNAQRFCGRCVGAEHRTYFLRMPVLVLPKSFVAPPAAGVSTAFPCDGAPWVAEVAPMLLPVVPWFSALLVFGPGEPPVPLIVWPLDKVPPGEPVEPVAAVPLAPEPLPPDPPAL